nr:hypothetical protein [Solirubrobacterales bacterium]
FNEYSQPISSPETGWAENDPALEIVEPRTKPPEAEKPVIVWRVTGPMDPALCSRLGPESNFIPGLKGE